MMTKEALALARAIGEFFEHDWVEVFQYGGLNPAKLVGLDDQQVEEQIRRVAQEAAESDKGCYWVERDDWEKPTMPSVTDGVYRHVTSSGRTLFQLDTESLDVKLEVSRPDGVALSWEGKFGDSPDYKGVTTQNPEIEISGRHYMAFGKGLETLSAAFGRYKNGVENYLRLEEKAANQR